MAQSPSNLNKPTPEIQVADAKGRIHKELWAWFGALGAVASWAVTGALSAGSLLLTTAPVTPANGVQYAGDAAWHEVGAVGEPAFQGAWANAGGGRATAAFRRMSDGLVIIKGAVTAGAGVIFTLPAGYRPALQENYNTLGNGAFAAIEIAANGDVSITAGASGAALWLTSPPIYAEA